MKTVFLAFVGLCLALNAQAQSSCPSPAYTEDIEPVCQSDWRIKLPCYSNPSAYYSCKTGEPLLTLCEGSTYMFTYVKQQCTTCADYIPTVECSALKIEVNCTPIANETSSTTIQTTSISTDSTTPSSVTTTNSGSTATDSASTTSKPTTTTVTTVATTEDSTVTTQASTSQASTTQASTTQASTTQASTTQAPTASGGDTTIYVPNPPSPNVGPTPPGPEPTPGEIPDEPPSK